VQRVLLSEYPSTELRVYAIWLPMLFTDSRGAWNGNTLPDPRVLHFWDGERYVGEWFAEKVEGYRGVSWDAYYLYSPDATWETIPTSLVASGGTIYDQREEIRTRLSSLIPK
jgi:hypothetical protein